MGACVQLFNCLTLLRPHGLYPTRLLCLWNFPGKNPGAGSHFLLHSWDRTFDMVLHLSIPGIEPTPPASPALAGGFFTTEPPEKPVWEEGDPKKLGIRI